MSEPVTEKKVIDIDEHTKIIEKADRFYAENVDLKKRLEALKDIDPDKYKGMREELELQKKQKVGDPKEIDSLIEEKAKEIRNEIQKEWDQDKTRLSTLQNQLKELQVVDAVFGKHATKFNSDVSDVVKGYIRQCCEISDDGAIIVKDETGKIRHKPGSATEKMNGDDFVAWLIEQKPSLAVSDARSGTRREHEKSSEGSGNNSRGLISYNTLKSMSSADQRKYLSGLTPNQIKQTFSNK